MRPILDLLKTALADWWNDNTFRLAASLAFYTIFSMAPVLLIAVTFASVLFGQDAATQQIVREIGGLVGEEGAETARQVLRAGLRIEGNILATAIGLGAILFGATVVFAELQAALNQIWDVQVRPDKNVVFQVLRSRLLGFGIALSVGFLLIVSLLVDAALSAAESFLGDRIADLPIMWRLLNWVGSFVIITLLFGLIYKVLPDVKITWRDVGIGAVVSAALFTVGKKLIGLYLGQAAIGSAYGAAGSFVVLLVWIYYSALIAFFGAEFTQVYTRRYGSRIRPQRHAQRIGNKSDDA
jgi:membrane protein